MDNLPALRKARGEMTEPDATPVWEASMQQLIAEIQRRCSGSLVITEEMPKDADADYHETSVSYNGGYNRALGLAERAKMKLINDLVPGWTARARIEFNGEEDQT